VPHFCIRGILSIVISVMCRHSSTFCMSVPLFVSLHHGIYEDEDEDTVIRGLDSLPDIIHYRASVSVSAEAEHEITVD
jgi:hypothetical protein